MAKKEFDEIHKKIDKILELSNNTNVRLSVVETKLNYASTSIDEQKKSMAKFVEDTVCQRKECVKKFDEIDNTFAKGQGAVWVIGFAGIVFGVAGTIWAFVTGIFK